MTRNHAAAFLRSQFAFATRVKSSNDWKMRPREFPTIGTLRAGGMSHGIGLN
jgi:hypothetical protein